MFKLLSVWHSGFGTCTLWVIFECIDAFKKSHHQSVHLVTSLARVANELHCLQHWPTASRRKLRIQRPTWHATGATYNELHTNNENNFTADNIDATGNPLLAFWLEPMWAISQCNDCLKMWPKKQNDCCKLLLLSKKNRIVFPMHIINLCTWVMKKFLHQWDKIYPLCCFKPSIRSMVLQCRLVWLRVKKTEINTTLWALWLGKSLRFVTLFYLRKKT